MLNDSVIQCMLMRGCLVSGSEYELTHKAKYIRPDEQNTPFCYVHVVEQCMHM